MSRLNLKVLWAYYLLASTYCLLFSWATFSHNTQKNFRLRYNLATGRVNYTEGCPCSLWWMKLSCCLWFILTDKLNLFIFDTSVLMHQLSTPSCLQSVSFYPKNARVAVSSYGWYIKITANDVGSWVTTPWF